MNNPPCLRLPQVTARSLFAVAFAALLGASVSPAHGQTAPENTPAQQAAAAAAEADKQETIMLDAFVATGSVAPRKQLESPVAISILDRGRLEDLAPRNLAEALKAVPGIYAESTAGEAFSNISIRGLTVSGFHYTMLYEDGLPVIATNNLRHGLPDAWTRLNTYVSSIEAMRSGTSNIFASQAPLALINFISREGSSVMRGEASFTTSDYGTLRSDLWVSGPAGTNTTFAVGGWYRVDDGVRYPGFVSNKGGELMGNIKHTFASDRGYIKASFKLHDDHNVFDLPMPMTGGANFRSVPFGPDIKRDPTSATADQRIISVANTPVGPVNYDLADGIYSQMNYFGTEFQFQLAEGVKLENRNRYSDGFRSIDYIFNGVPTAWQTIANVAANRDAAQFAAGRTGTNYAFRLTYPGRGGAVAAADATAAAALGNGLGNRKSWQHSAGPVDNIQNDLRLISTWNNGRTTATAGVYYSLLRQEQHYLFLTLLTDVTPAVNRVDITILDATTGAPIGPVTSNGIYHFADQYRNSTGEDREISPYVLFEHKMGAFTMDAGLRHNKTRQVLTRELTANTFVTGGSINPAFTAGQYGTGNFETRNNSASENAYTAGLNYAVNKRLAVYGRYSRGVRTLGITEFADDIVAGRSASPSRIVTGYEVGVKYGTPKLGVVLTAFHQTIKGIQDTQVTILPTGSIGPTVVALQSIESQGLELETTWSPIRGLSLGLNGNVQSPRWTDHNLKTQTLSTGQVVAFDENGLVPERTPKLSGKLLSSYRFPETALGRFEVNASYQYTGKRPVDRANGPINPLTAFDEFQAGIALTTKSGFSFRITGNNIFDGKGLSEGDPRGGSNVLDPTVSVFNARPIQPRTITGTVSYRF